ncbi:uncharacterized protein LOC132612973 [Lycium barbarum]|uniref:uncharacterized protein LOC132612973 n=1 Tax=Lycium barbarum TaxID=112863 RepID=UPI00293F533E|nr:uncharacterized protein LOC132612973 [Lycium barbarum]
MASYRIRDVAIQWYSNWISSRGINAPLPVWQEFIDAFFRHYLPPEVQWARADKFLNLRQGNTSAREPHSGQCHLGSDAYYGCGQTGHMIHDCSSMAGRGRVQPTGSATGSSSLVRPVKQVEVKKRQYEDPMLIHYKDTLPQKKKSPFEFPANGFLRYKGGLCVPDITGLRQQILGEAHHSDYCAHPGETKMYHHLKSIYWQYGMKKDIAEIVVQCLNCQ